ELAAHDQRLARLPRVLVLSKTDLVTEERARAAVAEWQQRLGPEGAVLGTSSATRSGIEELAGELLRRVAPLDLSDGEEIGGLRDASRGGAEELAEYMVFRPSAGTGFQVERLDSGIFAVRGSGIERLLRRYDIENDDAMAYLEGRLRRIGVLRALEAEGFEPGDEIEIAGMTFELDP